MKHVFVLWEDTDIATNQVIGVVEINGQDLAKLVADVYQDISGEKCVHAELRGVVASPSLLYSGLPRLDVGQENEEEVDHAG